MLSEEISTKLTGRYLNFETYTLDFKEYLDMKRFFHIAVSNDMEEEFNEYVLNGGFPKTLEFPEINARQVYTRGIIGKIFDKDVKKKENVYPMYLCMRECNPFF